ncbi:hypothetical protein OESDEN_18109 [Oesophagostomum dentatum]|uniref:Reverse transcriptase domain-containing protein n=1 Tax=Oesophagostomum dentatum TaxID=61180 RepID=A0A0B1SBB8_OESDE|nr:hypothetical protein OESDEN_18109 [Oesophagostomum dentatum]
MQCFCRAFVRAIRNCYENGTTAIRLFEREINIQIKRGVRQGYAISPKLFSTALQYAMKSLDWKDYGIQADGKNITNLRFADDVVLCAKGHEEAERMLNNLSETNELIGLELNMEKTKYMKNVCAYQER